MKSTLVAMLALLSFSLIASAADVTGKWTAEIPGRGGATATTTFNLKADGATLTGTVNGGRGGEQPISEGKVDGDNISFVQALSFNGNDVKISYKGVVKGDSIEFTREVGGRGGPATFTAKRAN
jgi:hypothetical protein